MIKTNNKAINHKKNNKQFVFYKVMLFNYYNKITIEHVNGNIGSCLRDRSGQISRLQNYKKLNYQKIQTYKNLFK